MVTTRPSPIDTCVALAGIVSLFGALAAVVMLLLASGPTNSVEAVAIALARTDDALQRGGRIALP